MNPTSDSRLRWTSTPIAVAVVLLLSTLIRVLLWQRYDGFAKGDEVEILEAAFRYGVGLEYEPWEIRNLTLPLVLAPALRLLAGLGVTSTDVLVDAAVAPFILAGTLNVLLVVELARRWSTDERVPVLAGMLYGTHWLLLVYGSAAFPRVVSTTAVLGGVLLVSRRSFDEESRGVPLARGLVAGALVGVAFAFRYSEGLFLVPLLALSFFEKDRRRAMQRAGMILAGFGAACCLLVGVVDWVTWSRPFSSLVALFNLTLAAGDWSSLEAVQPSWWYIKRLPHWLPLTALPLLWFAHKDRGTNRTWLFVVAVVVGLSLIEHKELRFLQGVWPFVAIGAAAGAGELMRKGRAGVSWSLVIVTLALGAARTTGVQKRSMAAVDAARHIEGSGSGLAALSQAWAYGDLLYLGAPDVIGLPLLPSEEDLRALPPGVEWVGLYTASLRSVPALHEVLEELGFKRSREFRRSRSQLVVLHERQGGP